MVVDGTIVRDTKTAARQRLLAALADGVGLEGVERRLVAQVELVSKDARSRVAVGIVDRLVHAGDQAFRECLAMIACRRCSGVIPRLSKSSNMRFDSALCLIPSTWLSLSMPSLPMEKPILLPPDGAEELRFGMARR